MKALIDGDIILYSCGFAAQHNHYSVQYISNDVEISVDADNKKDADRIAGEVDGDVMKTISVEPLANALKGARLMVESILEATKADSYIIYLSGDNNFREEIAPYYKESRKDFEKPYHYEAIKQYLINNWEARVIDGQEADDAMGIAQMESRTFHKEDDGHVEVFYDDSIICTIDKDLDMIPGYHYNWRKGAIYFIHPDDAINNFYKQLLKGDAVDDIPGLYKTAKKRCTKKILAGIDELPEQDSKWRYVVNQYGKDVDVETIKTIGKLLWIRRQPNEIWEPPYEEEEKCEEGK